MKSMCSSFGCPLEVEDKKASEEQVVGEVSGTLEGEAKASSSFWWA